MGRALRHVLVSAETPRARRWVPFVRRTVVRHLAALALESVEVSVTLVSDTSIRALNRRWRRKDEATDVLSFPVGDAPPGMPGPRLLGDVVVSIDTARARAKEEGGTVEGELALYLAHGLLHLLGHDHHRPAERRRMAALERRLLGGAGMIDAVADVAARPRAR